MTTTGTIPAAEALLLADLITPTERGIASRVLAKTGGGSITLFAFARGEGLSEHTSPFEALVLVLEGSIAITSADKASAPERARSCGCRPACRTRSMPARTRACC